MIFAFLFTLLSAHAAKIAYIGDSQSAVNYGVFATLRPVLATAGHSFVNGSGVCGATIRAHLNPSKGVCGFEGVTSLEMKSGKYDFVKGPGITQGLDKVIEGADTLLIQLGDNHRHEDAATVKREVQGMVERVLSAGKVCIWIGPASIADACADNLKKKRDVSARIAAALNDTEFVKKMNGRRCTFIDSFKASEANPPPSQDCLHYTNYKPWVEPVQDRILEAIAAAPKSKTEGGVLRIPPTAK